MFFSRKLWLFFIVWLCGSLLYIPNAGGYGLSLPQNCFSWGMMGILILSVSIAVIRQKLPLIITPALCWFTGGVVVLALPLFLTRPEWLFNGALYWAGAAIGLLFYLSCSQLNPDRHTSRLLIFLWLLACMTHALLILLQLTPAGGWIDWPVVNSRPNGVFQQVNLLATFLACGTGLALYLFFTPENRESRQKRVFISAALIIFPCVLMLIQSRIGWLSAVITTVMMLILTGTFRQKYQAVLLLSVGVLAGWWLKSYTRIGDISHLNSDSARLEMLSSTWEMLKQRPLTGWGTGGFEYTFQLFRVWQGKSTEGLGVVTHPHNEILFWGAEGGVIALTGLALILAGGIKIVTSAWYCYRRDKNPLPLALCVIVLPVLLHTQTEYPFGLSALHFALCLLLLAQTDKISNVSDRNVSCPSPVGTCISVMTVIVSSGVIIWMSCAFSLGLILTEIERKGMQDLQSLTEIPEIMQITQHERVEFDRNINKLIQYNRSRNPVLLDEYQRWAESYLEIHIDENVYYSLIMILDYQGCAKKRDIYLSQARKLFPQSNKFTQGM